MTHEVYFAKKQLQTKWSIAKISNIPKVIAYNSGTAGPSLIPTYVVSKTKQNKQMTKKHNKMKQLKGFMIKYLEN